MAEIFAHEGGFVDHPRDPGGATNMGITIGTLRAWRQGSVSKEDVRLLSKAEARSIYRTNYWDMVRGDELRAGVDLVALDPAVNSGVRRGVQWLQRAAGVVADGRIGPITVRAANAARPAEVIKKACEIRMGFLRGLRTFGTFGRGWSRRVARVEAVALRMAMEAADLAARPTLIEAKHDAEASAGRDAKAAGGVAVGGGGVAGGLETSVADMPVWVLSVVGVIVAIAVFNLWGRRQHQQARAAAFQKVAEEARA